ncbi:MAG TPA: gamma-glutamyl-gamma-aminobutyrate hydrolase family protein [Acidimicrobiales bacterium]|nr:gamma-glutamyl-gamma-aminobutyrate hydrolase family protein [Acidimicrobiales bacterium]
MSGGGPLVGLTTYATEATFGPWSRPAALVPASYVELVAEAGARPLLVPPLRSAPEENRAGESVVNVLDALVLIGGGDVDPAAYGETAGPDVGAVDPGRDESEMALLGAALDRDLPVLAICRGLQVLNVYLGGSLYQHLPDAVGHTGHRPGPGRSGDIEVVTEAGTLAAALYGPRTTVCCSHHQSVRRLAEGLVVSARSVEGPGVEPVIEAVELLGRRFVFGVQWHPEESGDRRPFDALLAAI